MAEEQTAASVTEQKEGKGREPGTFQLVSDYKPSGDQPEAIKELVEGVKEVKQCQVLMGATGTGKTFTISNVIEQVGRPTLVFAHNKTLASQLYAEFKEFFPHNHVEYFVSYFDYYQPEAYIPKSDTYIDKNTKTNEELDMLRLAAANAALNHRDTIIVASVASIYGASNPDQYRDMIETVRVGQEIDRRELMQFLVRQQYKRNDLDPVRGTFRVRGDTIEISPGHTDRYLIRIEMFGDEIDRLSEINVVTGSPIRRLQNIPIWPATHYVTPKEKMDAAIQEIYQEMEQRVALFESEGKLIEAQRIKQSTLYDIEMMQELGYCSGIENYSRVIEGRPVGSPPNTLMDYFPKDFVLFIDESHVTLPQCRAMYGGDLSRKMNLVEHGFRLPAALDNRPLRFEEFERLTPQVLYVSATPADYELEKCEGVVVEQIIRPTRASRSGHRGASVAQPDRRSSQRDQ